MITDSISQKISDIMLAVGAKARLRYVLDPLLKITPERLQRSIRASIHKAKVRRGYNTPLVPEKELEERYRLALWELSTQYEGGSLGDYLEFGVCHGRSIKSMYRALCDLELESIRLFGFDSFEGLPETAKFDDNGIWKPGDYESDFELTKKRLTQAQVDWSRLVLVKGWFSDTLTDHLIQEHHIQKASLIMIDCDMYLSAKEALNFCAPLIQDHALIFFDDWYAYQGRLAKHNMGESRAFHEFLDENPELTAEERPEYKYCDNAVVFMVRRGVTGAIGVFVTVGRLAEIISL